MPAQRHVVDAGKRLALAHLQVRARLDEVHTHGLAELRHRARGAQRIGHHGAAAGAELDQLDRFGAPIARHAVAAHSPISSPNIWLISGAVTKSPAAPKRRGDCNSRAPDRRGTAP